MVNRKEQLVLRSDFSTFSKNIHGIFDNKMCPDTEGAR